MQYGLLTRCVILLGLAGAFGPAQAQKNNAITADSVRSFSPGRFAIVMAAESALATTTLIGLNELWYKDYPRSSFHFFNDNKEWLQMDKVGHAWTAYQLSDLGYSALRWSGVKENKSAWYGGLTGMSYQLIIELLDGFSTEWGFSMGDFAGNLSGSAMFTAQQLAWHEQRFNIKYSYHYTKYAALHPELLGSNGAERLLKDYNGQTYWLSCSPGSFLKRESRFPRWIAFSLGYSAEGMLGGRDNNDVPGYENIERSRRFLLSADIDFSKIPVKSKFWHSVLSVINVLKVPFPALEYNTHKGMQGHWIYL
jgi:hypothetical protein